MYFDTNEGMKKVRCINFSTFDLVVCIVIDNSACKHAFAPRLFFTFFSTQLLVYLLSTLVLRTFGKNFKVFMEKLIASSNAYKGFLK